MQIGVETSRSVENKRIFVVDSNEIDRAVLQFILHDENETHEFADLGPAYLKAETWKPDLILLGTALIEERGPAVLREIRERLPGARVVVVGTSAGSEFSRACLQAGAHAMLPKPLTIESVRRKVDLQLGRRAALAIPVHRA